MNYENASKMLLDIFRTIENLQNENDDLRAQLSAQSVSAVQPVADIRLYRYSGIAKNGEFFEAVIREGVNVKDGDKLYLHPADADAVDAKRYRWLRSCGEEFDSLQIMDLRGNIVAEELDKAIDAAMAQSTEGAKG